MTDNDKKFESLKNRWLEEAAPKRISSNEVDYYTPAYLDIIGMGYDALPSILNQLLKEGEEPDHWFFALSMITHINPVPRELRGYMHEMSKKWIEWGYEKGIIKPKNAIENLKKEIQEKFAEKKTPKRRTKAPVVREKKNEKAPRRKKASQNS